MGPCTAGVGLRCQVGHSPFLGASLCDAQGCRGGRKAAPRVPTSLSSAPLRGSSCPGCGYLGPIGPHRHWSLLVPAGEQQSLGPPEACVPHGSARLQPTPSPSMKTSSQSSLELGAREAASSRQFHLRPGWSLLGALGGPGPLNWPIYTQQKWIPSPLCPTAQ